MADIGGWQKFADTRGGADKISPTLGGGLGKFRRHWGGINTTPSSLPSFFPVSVLHDSHHLLYHPSLRTMASASTSDSTVEDLLQETHALRSANAELRSNLTRTQSQLQESQRNATRLQNECRANNARLTTSNVHAHRIISKVEEMVIELESLENAFDGAVDVAVAGSASGGEIVDIPNKIAQALELQEGLMKVMEKMLKREEEEEERKSQKWSWSWYNMWIVFRDAGYLIVTGYCANLIAGRHGAYLDRDKCQ